MASARERSSTLSSETTAPGTRSGTPMRRPPPLPAVKGTMGGIESPRREIMSPVTSNLRGDAPSAPPSTLGVSTMVSAQPSDSTLQAVPPTPLVVFRSDARLKTSFDSLPEGAEEVKALFGIA